MADVIDTLAIELVANDKFSAVAEKMLETLERLEKQFGATGDAEDDFGNDVENTGKKVKKSAVENDKAIKSLEKSEKQTKKNVVAAKNLIEVFTRFTKVLGVLGSIAMAGVGLNRLAEHTSQANIELDNMAKNLGMSRQTLQAWQGAAEASGGSVEGMTGYLNHLSNGLQNFVTSGDTSVLPFFQALGIGIQDTSGNIRPMNDLLLDLASKFETMDRAKARAFASQHGMDDGTFNFLAQGQAKVREMLAQQSKIYRSNDKDIETSRKLTEATRRLNQQWDALKTKIGNMVAPVLLKISGIVERFFAFITQNETLVEGAFMGIAGALTVVLIPAILSAAAATWSFLAPFLPIIALVAVLAGGFALLYEDYKTWAEGGNSLFNWENFIKWLDGAKFSVGNLMKGFFYLLTGYQDLDDAIDGGKTWLKMKGIIDDNGVSIKGLMSWIGSLCNQLLNELIPIFNRVADIVGAVFVGDWDKVRELAKQSWVDTGNWLTSNTQALWDWVANRFTGAMDVTGGYDPEKDKNSWTQMRKSGEAYNHEGAIGRPRVNEDGTLVNPKSTLSDGEELLAKAVSSGEGNYNSVNRGLVNGKLLGSYEEDLSQLTINEILARNKLDVNDPRRMNAVGRYQIINSTLRDLKGRLGLSGEEKFTPEMQDRLFRALLPDSAKNYINGKSDNKTQALIDISKKWASVGVPTAMQGQNRWVQAGESYYAGDGGNKANKHSLRLVSNGLDIARYNGNTPTQPQKNPQNQPRVDPNQPIGGIAVASALNGTVMARESMYAMAQPQQINNNQRTEVSINGGVHIQTAANTMSGAGADMIQGIQQRANPMLYNNGVS